jgi:drug/metabolite transporter (DMT)-like permease
VIEKGSVGGGDRSPVDESTTGTLMVVGAAVGFGTIGVWGELALAVDLELATLLPVRFLVATAALFALSAARGWSPVVSPRTGLATIGLGVAYASLTLSFFVALEYLTASLAIIILYTYPAFVFVLSAAFLGETVTARKVVALCLALSGVVLVVGADAAGADPLGVGLVLVAALSYAVYTTGSRSLLPAVPVRTLMSGMLAGTTACMLVYGALAGGMALPAGRDEWGIVLGLATVGTVAPLVLFYGGLSRLEAGRVGVVSTVEPVVTVLLGAAILGEPITPPVVVGGALVLAGVVLIRGG